MPSSAWSFRLKLHADEGIRAPLLFANDQPGATLRCGGHHAQHEETGYEKETNAELATLTGIEPVPPP